MATTAVKYRVLRADSRNPLDKKLYHNVVSSCGGRCQAHVVEFGNASKVHARCSRAMVWVIAGPSGAVGYCNECRVAAFGLTPGEKSVRTKSDKKKQTNLF